MKTIDFGLATFFDPTALPVTGLNVEGTPWCDAFTDALQYLAV